MFIFMTFNSVFNLQVRMRIQRKINEAEAELSVICKRNIRLSSRNIKEIKGGASKNPNDLNVSGILDSLLRGYDKRIRPNYGGPRVDVGITMYILTVRDMSEERMDFTMDFYFRQFWKDNRLGFVAKNGVDSLSVGAELAKNIWVPDTFFANEKSAYFHEATTSNSFLRISSTGDISRSIRLTVTATCPMNLQYFPMDRQLCTIEIESFGYTMRDIRYKWNAGENSIGISTEVQLPQFRVVGHRQKTKEIILTTGNYSRLACEIQFVRSMGYYLIQIYIPSSLIVVISWVSFWLNRNATPARVSLGVTTVLTMTTLMSSTNAALPKISYVKSIDIFLGTCFVMVFASLLEYATVGYLGKRIQMRKTRFQNLQKLADQRKPVLPPSGEANHTDNPAGPPMDPPMPIDGRKKTPDPKDPRHDSRYTWLLSAKAKCKCVMKHILMMGKMLQMTVHFYNTQNCQNSVETTTLAKRFPHS
ncbi:hypothetical protein CHUAL_012773 [Chamberlinius hualienensis]